MTSFAKWAIALLIVMILTIPVGVGLFFGALLGIQSGIGAALAALGVSAGFASRWIGDS